MAEPNLRRGPPAWRVGGHADLPELGQDRPPCGSRCVGPALDGRLGRLGQHQGDWLDEFNARLGSKFAWGRSVGPGNSLQWAHREGYLRVRLGRDQGAGVGGGTRSAGRGERMGGPNHVFLRRALGRGEADLLRRLGGHQGRGGGLGPPEREDAGGPRHRAGQSSTRDTGTGGGGLERRPAELADRAVRTTKPPPCASGVALERKFMDIGSRRWIEGLGLGISNNAGTAGGGDRPGACHEEPPRGNAARPGEPNGPASSKPGPSQASSPEPARRGMR